MKNIKQGRISAILALILIPASVAIMMSDYLLGYELGSAVMVIGLGNWFHAQACQVR